MPSFYKDKVNSARGNHKQKSSKIGKTERRLHKKLILSQHFGFSPENQKMFDGLNEMNKSPMCIVHDKQVISSKSSKSIFNVKNI